MKSHQLLLKLINQIGIGRDTVRRLASAGASVVAVSKTLELLESLKQEVSTSLISLVVN